MPASPQKIQTPLTKMLGIQHPVILAGVIGGVGYTPKFLKQQIDELKEGLEDKKAPFGVDLLLPQVGGSARKTNYDYTGGKLNELIDIIIDSGARLFVSAVGVPPKEVVDKLHKAKIPVANIIGHPKHATKAIEAGVDMIIFQAGEGGGHTGDIPFTVLAPRVVDIVRGHKSPLTGEQIVTVAAGGIFNGRGLASALMYGAAGVWVGTRFVASVESGAPKRHKEAVLTSDHNTDTRTLIFTGRPLRLRRTPYVDQWEARPDEMRKLLDSGKIPYLHDMEHDDEKGSNEKAGRDRFLLGKCAAVIEDILPAKQIVDEMVEDARKCIESGNSLVVGGGRAKL